jgi:hypothetical protein
VILKTGKFTQNIWKSTTLIGIGYAWNTEENPFAFHNYVVATFSPGGNIDGAYEENVLPLLSDRKIVKRVHL